MKLLSDYLDFGTIFFQGNEFHKKWMFVQIDTVATYIEKFIPKFSPFVYLFAENHIKTLIAYFGIIKAGRIVVLVNPKIGAFELADMLSDTPPAAILRIDESLFDFNLEKEFEIISNTGKCIDLSQLEDVCTICYTAAMDGIPKGAMLTNASLYENAKSVALANSVTPGTTTSAYIPIYQMYGLQTGLITPSIVNGNILISNDFDLRKIRSYLKEFLKSQVSRLYSIPTIFYLLSKFKDIDLIPKNISIISGGCQLPDQLYRLYQDKFNLEIREGYGLTEASPVCSWRYPGDPYIPGLIGKPMSCCEMEIFDPKMNQIEDGAVGEICIRGTHLMKGYYSKPEYNEKIMEGGWFHTGDLGYKYQNDYVVFSKVQKDMCNFGGIKIYRNYLKKLYSRIIKSQKFQISCSSDNFLNHSIELVIHDSQGTINTDELKKTFHNSLSSFHVPHSILIKSTNDE